MVIEEAEQKKPAQEVVHDTEVKPEQTTPDKRAELMKKREDVKKLMTDAEARAQKESIRIAEETKKTELEVAEKFKREPGMAPELVAKVQAEGGEMDTLLLARKAREIAELKKQDQAIETQLGSGTSHEATPSHSPEQAVLETSKDLAPDMKKETSAQSEHPDQPEVSGGE